jgi:hypothetical protein
MKKTIQSLIFAVVLLYGLCGCSLGGVMTGSNIETLKSWSFQSNSGTNDYSLFFGLENRSGKSISADVDVDIRIVNDQNEEVYSGTKAVTKSDFGHYSSEIKGKHYLANVIIAAADIKPGKSTNGTVYLKVHKGDAALFDEVDCAALYCLPISDVKVTAENLPFEVVLEDFLGEVESKIQIESVDCIFDKSIRPQLKIAISGTKTYQASGSYSSILSMPDIMYYKLYDSSGYMVKSGMIMLSSVGQGDKFKNDKTVIYDITPGDTYTLKITGKEYEAYSSPISDVKVTTENLPFEVVLKGYDGKVQSKIQIENVDYTFDKSIVPQLKIIISGTKTYQASGLYSLMPDIMNYKLYDSGGYMVESGMISLSSVEQGDKFKNDKTVIYDITPGETYTLKITGLEW